jgi:NADH-quinone oxidoreductase subunit G
VRRLHRYLPGRRAHQRHLPLPDAPLGDDPRGHHLHALRRWLQDHARHAQRPIIRGNNRDRSGINGEFLCIKGRYAFDFYDHPERLQSPLLRVERQAGRSVLGRRRSKRWREVQRDPGRRRHVRRDRLNHTTNEENFYLQKFARQVLKTNHIDHHRTGDVVTLLDALSGKTALATVADLYERKAILVLGADLALEHPMLSYQIRANYRHHQAHVYVVTPQAVREDKYAAASVRGDRLRLSRSATS